MALLNFVDHLSKVRCTFKDSAGYLFKAEGIKTIIRDDLVSIIYFTKVDSNWRAIRIFFEHYFIIINNPNKSIQYLKLSFNT